MSIELIFSGSLDLSQVFIEYIKMIESLGVKIDKLTSSKLNAGLSALKQAANNDNERENLLREARERFNEATSLEKNERLAMAYIDLAICHDQLNDKTNCCDALQRLDDLGINEPLHNPLKITEACLTQIPLITIYKFLTSKPIRTPLADGYFRPKERQKALDNVKSVVLKHFRDDYEY